MKVSLCAPWESERDGIADYSRYFAEGLRHHGIEVIPVNLERYCADPVFYREAARRANQADLCHVQFNYLYFNGELPYKNRFPDFAQRLTVPLVATVHEVRIGFDRTYRGFRSRFREAFFQATLPLWNGWSRRLHQAMYNRMDRIIAHSQQQTALIRPFLMRRDTLAVIPHPIPEVSHLHGQLGQSAAKVSLGLAPQSVVLTLFGFINARKGYEETLEALTRLPAHVVLLIAGGSMTDSGIDSAYYDTLTRLIDAKGLKERVIIAGYIPQERIGTVMAATDICLAPFHSDGHASGALSRYISYAKPVAASDIPVHREINERVPCLELFERDGGADLSAKLGSLLRDFTRRSELSRAAQEYRGQFSYNEGAAAAIALYKTVLEKGRNG